MCLYVKTTLLVGPSTYDRHNERHSAYAENEFKYNGDWGSERVLKVGVSCYHAAVRQQLRNVSFDCYCEIWPRQRKPSRSRTFHWGEEHVRRGITRRNSYMLSTFIPLTLSFHLAVQLRTRRMSTRAR